MESWVFGGINLSVGLGTGVGRVDGLEMDRAGGVTWVTSSVTCRSTLACTGSIAFHDVTGITWTQVDTAVHEMLLFPNMAPLAW